MKKTAVIVITLVGSTNNAFYGSQLIQKEHSQEYEQPHITLVPVDEYTTHAVDEYTSTSNEDNQNQTDIDEYDQHVSDESQAPKISAAEALIKEMLGFVLIQYLVIKELAHLYCQEIKDALQQWFGVFTKVAKK